MYAVTNEPPFRFNAETGENQGFFDPAFDKSVRATFISIVEYPHGLTAKSDSSILVTCKAGSGEWTLRQASSIPDLETREGGLGWGMADNFPQAQYGLTSLTTVCGDVVVAGGLVSDGNPKVLAAMCAASKRVQENRSGVSTLCHTRENPGMKLGSQDHGRTAEEPMLVFLER